VRIAAKNPVEQQEEGTSSLFPMIGPRTRHEVIHVYAIRPQPGKPNSTSVSGRENRFEVMKTWKHGFVIFSLSDQ
jgi:hypothetical protein